MEEKAGKYIVHYEGCIYEIEEDLSGLGWYVYRFDNNGICTHDFLQDDLNMAIICAEDEFGVPKEMWEI